VAFSVTNNGRFNCKVSRMSISRPKTQKRKSPKGFVSLKGISRELAKDDVETVTQEENDVSEG
jgi:hypothetical protein